MAQFLEVKVGEDGSSDWEGPISERSISMNLVALSNGVKSVRLSNQIGGDPLSVRCIWEANYVRVVG